MICYIYSCKSVDLHCHDCWVGLPMILRDHRQRKWWEVMVCTATSIERGPAAWWLGFCFPHRRIYSKRYKNNMIQEITLSCWLQLRNRYYLNYLNYLHHYSFVLYGWAGIRENNTGRFYLINVCLCLRWFGWCQLGEAILLESTNTMYSSFLSVLWTRP